VTTALDLAAALGHERVIAIHDPATGLRSVVAIHSTALGPAVGGTRMRSYASFDDAVVDALHLSRAMTYKAGFAGLPLGGAKAVLDADPSDPRKDALLEAHARATAELAGRFISGGDMNVGAPEVAWMARFSKVYEHPPASAGAPDPSELTAIGVLSGLGATARALGLSLAKSRVAIQGVGEVGGRLARRLAVLGARLVIADADAGRARDVGAATGADVVAPEEILFVDCDVLSPNAAGGGIDLATIDRLRCRGICGAANNPLAGPGVGDELARRGVLYAPDFVVSAGGILSLHFDWGELDAAGTTRRAERIGEDLAELFAAAVDEGVAPFRLAERRVDAKLEAARASAG